MTLLQLNYIMEIYNCGSINKAAQNLFVSQSSISSSIKELEEEIGITIFLRNNRGIILTEDGREFIAQIRPLLEQSKKIQRFYTERNSTESVRFSVSTLRYPFCVKAFIRFMYEQEKPSYELSIKEREMSRVLEDVSERKSDIGIVFLSDMTRKFMMRIFNSRDLEFKELKQVDVHVFMNQNHPLAQKETLSLVDLKSYPHIVFSKKDNSSMNFSEEVVLTDTIECRRIIYINDRATAYNIMAYTDAISTGSGMLPEGYYDDRIVAVPLNDTETRMCLGYIKIKEMPLSEKAEQFLKILKEVLEEGICE